MKPLAYRVRPKDFSDIVGQEHLVGKNGVITKMLNNDKLCSMILYGPAGCGKTSIAEIISNYYSLSSFSLSYSLGIKSLDTKVGIFCRVSLVFSPAME